MRLVFHSLTPDRWPDLEELFGPGGACAGCWCMWWRLERGQWKNSQGEANRRAFRKLVRSAQEPGILAYAGGRPVGWCAVAPRESYPRLERSNSLGRVDSKPVWSITCLYVDRHHRNQGLSVALLKEAVKHARRHGARMVEGYPVQPDKRLPGSVLYTGTVSAFTQAGFKEVARRLPARPIVRRQFSGAK